MLKAKSTTKESPRKAVTELPIKQRNAPWSLIELWAETVCGTDDPEGRMSAFLLLLDEVERSASDYLRVGLIVRVAQQAAFGRSEHAGDAKQKLVDDLRAKHGLRIVDKKRDVA